MPVASLEYLIIAFVFALNGLWVAALLSAANYDKDIWLRAGRDKQSWILLLIFFSGLAAAVYLLRVRKDLRSAVLEG